MSGLSFPHGFYNDEWQKVPIPFGFSGPIGERVSINPTIVGANTADGTVTPAGEAWIIQAMSLISNVFAGSNIRIQLVRGSLTLNAHFINAPTAGIAYPLHVGFVMFEGDVLRLISQGDPGGAALHMDYVGVKIDIDK